MSKIAVLSDVHANIDALELVLKDIEKKNIDKIICLGDLVAKYFYPDKVVDAIKDNCFIFIKGNCDELVATNKNYKFARSKLGIDRIDFLDNLPLYSYMNINDININLFHATPNSIDDIFNPLFDGNNYTDYKDKTLYDYKDMFVSVEKQVSIVGHTHQSYLGIEEDRELKIVEDELLISKDDRAIINVGSAGEHSHMVLNNFIPDTIIDPYLTYVILDDSIDNKIKVSTVKVPYKETFKKVYYDSLRLQENGSVPFSPNDTKRREKSLRLM